MSIKSDPLPSWEQCQTAVKAGNATVLESFIYEQEPSGEEAEIAFRTALKAVLAEFSALELLNVLYAARHARDMWREYGLKQTCMTDAMVIIEAALNLYDAADMDRTPPKLAPPPL